VNRAVNLFVALDATAEQLNGWAEIVEEFADRIEADPPGSVLWGIGARGIFGVSGMRTRLPMEAVPNSSRERVTGRVTFGREQ
jgi:hypothetical protein